MDFAGLIGKFRTGCPLTQQEREFHLKQKKRLDVIPYYQLSVIEMNSTYLEVVDKWYAERGTITGIMLTAILMLATLFSGMLYMALTWDPNIPGGDDDVFILVIIGVFSAPVLIAAGWALRKEMFAYTHYPIRLNRATRTVNVFRTDGTVLSTPWDAIFFTMAPVDQLYKFWNILGHVLDEDKLNIKESFALSITSDGSQEGIDTMRSHWEFVRRYMEEGPSSVNSQVQFCMPINRRRETLRVAANRMLANSTGGGTWSLPLRLFSFLFNSMVIPFRYIAMHTSRIPRWPSDIETKSKIHDDDPYAITGSKSGERINLFPAAAEAANVRFTGPPGSLGDGIGGPTNSSSLVTITAKPNVRRKEKKG